jgi:hypothetical protein
MWEHGMPGSAWTMAADLLRWEELRDDTDDDLALIASQEGIDEPGRAQWWPAGESPQGNWWRRRFGISTLTAIRGS